MRSLRIIHNGNVFEKNPHWHLIINDQGAVLGEIIGRQSGFQGIQQFKKQLAEPDTKTLFAEVDAMRPHYSPVEVQPPPDDIIVHVKEQGKTVVVFAIPLKEQQTQVVSVFGGIINQMLGPYI